MSLALRSNKLLRLICLTGAGILAAVTLALSALGTAWTQYDFKMTVEFAFDPMLERSPEAFPQPHTIPDGWDLSEWLAAPASPEQASAAGYPGGDEHRV